MQIYEPARGLLIRRNLVDVLDRAGTRVDKRSHRGFVERYLNRCKTVEAKLVKDAIGRLGGAARGKTPVHEEERTTDYTDHTDKETNRTPQSYPHLSVLYLFYPCCRCL